MVLFSIVQVLFGVLFGVCSWVLLSAVKYRVRGIVKYGSGVLVLFGDVAGVAVV